LDESVLKSENVVPLSLQECMRQALTSSRIIRDLNGTIIRTPQVANSVYSPALVFSNARSGEEAALSAFDANFFASSLFEENNRRFNNQFFGNLGAFEQYLSTSQVGANKRSATGGLYSLRNVTVSDVNNQLGNRLGKQSWESYLEAEARQPLLRGAGTEFNRIAGPNGAPGELNGVLLARTNTDQSLIEFERAIRDLVADVENAYWDLYYAYRDLEAKISVRDIAKKTYDVNLKRDDADASDRFQAEEQYHRFQADVVDALIGRPVDGTRTNNGSSGGTFRPTGGIRMAERKLRLLIGSPINDGRLIQTLDVPSVAPVFYDWNSVIAEALRERQELVVQRWEIKQKELELIANRNFLMPQLDLISRYRLRGFGDDLFSNNSISGSFYNGNFQEWALGLEYQIPVGLRRAHAAVRNSQIALAREVEILREQERIVHLGLSNAINDASRALQNVSLQEQRLTAIVNQLNALDKSRDKQEKLVLVVELETHRRLLDARLHYHQAQVEYALSLRNVHFEKGTLLAYNNVMLSESISPRDAVMKAVDRIGLQDCNANTYCKDIQLAN